MEKVAQWKPPSPLYLFLVPSMLKYWVQFETSYFKSHIEKHERVEQMATKIVKGIRPMSTRKVLTDWTRYLQVFKVRLEKHNWCDPVMATVLF